MPNVELKLTAQDQVACPTDWTSQVPLSWIILKPITENIIILSVIISACTCKIIRDSFLKTKYHYPTEKKLTGFLPSDSPNFLPY